MPSTSRSAPAVRVTRLLAGVLAAALVPGGVAQPLAARGQSALEAFVGRNERMLGERPYAGLGFTGYQGRLGVRLSGGLRLDRRDDDALVAYPRCVGCGPRNQDDDRLAVGAWTADADVLYVPLRDQPAARRALFGLSPYGLLGMGGYAQPQRAASNSGVLTWSYGAGATLPMFGRLALSAEARRRQPLGVEAEHATYGVGAGWEYRGGLALALGSDRGARRARTPARRPAPPVRRPAPPPSRERDRDDDDGRRPATARVVERVLDAADELVGTRYRPGGASPSGGFDAGGFVQYVFAREGVRLPRTAARMAEAGEPVSPRVRMLRPGDLLLFANDHVTVDHVAVYVGFNQIVHASASGNEVRYDVLGDGERGRWFADHLVGARRVAAAGARPSSRDDDRDAPDRAPRPTRRPR